MCVISSLSAHLLWISAMLRACDKCFVDYECVPEDKLSVEFTEKPRAKAEGEVDL